MRWQKLSVVVTAVAALAGLSASGNIYQATVKGTIYMTNEAGDKIVKTKFTNADLLSLFGGTQVLVDSDTDQVFVDTTDNNVMAVESSTCTTAEKSTSTKLTDDSVCVEGIALFDDGSTDGGVVCTIHTETTDTTFTFKKKCTGEAVDPTSGSPITFTVQSGNEVPWH